MGYEDVRRSNSSVVAIAVVVALLMVVGVVVLGMGALFVLGTQTITRVERDRAVMAGQEAQVQMERQLALAEMEKAQAAQQAATAAAEKQQPVSRHKVTITLDEHGNIAVDGEPVVLDDLESQLQAIGKAADAALSVVIRADDRCLFQHVSSVLAICREAAVDDVDVAPLSPAEGDDTSAAGETTSRTAR